MRTIGLQSIVFIYSNIEPRRISGSQTERGLIIMYTTYSQVPFYRKNWFAILTFFLLTPVFLLVLFTGPIYYQKNGGLRTYGKGVRWVFAILVGLAMIGAIVGAPKSTTVMAQQPSSMMTPTVPASSATPHPEQQVTAAPRRDSVAQEASGTQAGSQFDGVGPSIKGMQLGLSDPQVRPAVLQNVRSIEVGVPTDERYRYRVIAASDIHELIAKFRPIETQFYSEEKMQALNQLSEQSGWPNFDYGGALNLDEQFQDGMWLLVWKPTGDIVLAVHYSSTHNLVDWYQIDGPLSIKLFGAGSMSNQDFAQAIANNYNIPSLDPGQPDALDVKMAGIAAMRGVNYDLSIPYSYESGDGWHIDVKGKTITVSQVTPQSQRFN